MKIKTTSETDALMEHFREKFPKEDKEAVKAWGERIKAIFAKWESRLPTSKVIDAPVVEEPVVEVPAIKVKPTPKGKKK